MPQTPDPTTPVQPGFCPFCGAPQRPAVCPPLASTSPPPPYDGPNGPADRPSDFVGAPPPWTKNFLMRPRAVAAALGVSNATIGRLVRSGKLPATRVGRQIRIASSDLAEFLRR